MSFETNNYKINTKYPDIKSASKKLRINTFSVAVDVQSNRRTLAK